MGNQELKSSLIDMSKNRLSEKGEVVFLITPNSATILNAYKVVIRNIKDCIEQIEYSIDVFNEKITIEQ